MNNNLKTEIFKIRSTIQKFNRNVSNILGQNLHCSYDEWNFVIDFSDIKIEKGEVVLYIRTFGLKNREYKKTKDMIRKKYNILNDIKITKIKKSKNYSYKASILFGNEKEKNIFIMENL